MGKDDLEKGGAGLPDLSDVYGGIEDSRHVGGVAEDPNEAIVTPSPSSDPKSPGSGSSWFTKKRIIIIAVVSILVVAGAVGGAVGGVLGSKNNNNGDTSGASDSQSTGSGSETSATTNTPASTTRGSSSSTPTIANANTNALGAIMPPGFTAVAFNNVAAPSSSPSASVISIQSGFPGLAAPLSEDTIVVNGDFTQNFTGWDNVDGCWDLADWNPGYISAWNGESRGPKGCTLAQSITRRDTSAQDYIFSFLYRNSDRKVDPSSQFWAFVGDEDEVFNVLSTTEAAPTSDDNWSKYAVMYTIKEGKSPTIWFRSVHSGDLYWEVTMVQLAPYNP